MSDTTVSTYDQLVNAIEEANSLASGSDEIDITRNIQLAGILPAISLAPGVTLLVNGEGTTLDGGQQYRGFAVEGGAVEIANLTILNAAALGGAGTGAGGGGAGLGGALFIGSEGTVTLSGIAFSGDSAVGGDGGYSAGGVADVPATPQTPSPGQPGTQTDGGAGGSGTAGTAGTQGGAGGGGGMGGAGFDGIGAGGAGGAGGAAPSTSAGYTGAGGHGGAGGAGGVQNYPATQSGGAGVSENGSTAATTLDGENGAYGMVGQPGTSGDTFGGGGGGAGGGSGGSGGGGGGGAGGGGGGSGYPGVDSPASGGPGGAHGGPSADGGPGGRSTTGYAVTGGAGGFGAGAGADESDGEDGGNGGVGQPGTAGQSGVPIGNQYVVPGGSGGAGGMGGTGGRGGTGGSAQGGGGLGAGGDIFVADGGQLAFTGAANLSGTATGGSGANDGSGFGGAVFEQGTDGTLTLSPALGTRVVISSSIADQSGSDPTNEYNDPGTLTVDANGPGTVELGAANSFAGLLDIAGGTVILSAAGASGARGIAITGAASLQFSIADAPTTEIDGFGGSDAIGVTDLATIGTAIAYVGANGIVTLRAGSQSVQLNLGSGAAGEALTLNSDGSGGSRVVAGATIGATTTIYAGTEAELNQSIAYVDGATSGSITIVLTRNITEGTGVGAPIAFGGTTLNAPADLYAFNLQSDVAVTLDGAGFTLDGAGEYRGLLAYAGDLTIENLTIQRAEAIGGNGTGSGGGGAGLGGAVFVGGTNAGSAGANVTLVGVAFSDDGAQGGLGGAGGTSGAGGGLGGDASPANANGSISGGGAGSDASGDAGAPGVILGVAAGQSGPFGGSGIGSGGGGVGGTAAGDGGFGGGGGDMADADGGFGGGGGGTDSDGGFGGGGSGGAGTGVLADGGFGGGGGSTNSKGGGGGLAAGGDIFVQQGGTLTIDEDTDDNLAGGAQTMVAGTVMGGQRRDPGAASGGAYGNGLFIQGNQTVTIDLGGYDTLIQGVIADQSGSGGTGSYAGSGSLVIAQPTPEPAGDLSYIELEANNPFTGGIMLETEVWLDLETPGAAGTGAVTFGPGGAEKLSLGLLSPPSGGIADAPAGGIEDFSNGDTITVTNAPYADYTASFDSATDILSLQPSSGDSPLQLQLFGAYASSDFNVTRTSSTLNLTTGASSESFDLTVGSGPPTAPVISGTRSGQDTSNNAAIKPFIAVNIVDRNVAPTETLTITLSGAAGTLSGGGISGGTGGVYTLTGGPSDVTANLRDVSFTPDSPSGSTGTTTFTLSDQSSASLTSATDANTTVTDTVYAITITPETPSALERNQSTDIGVITENPATDPLTLQQTGGSGRLTLHTQTDGSSLLEYDSPGLISSSTLDAFSFTVTDRGQNVSASGSASVQLDSGPKIQTATPATVQQGQTTVIGTVYAGLSGDTLSLSQTTGNGTVSLGTNTNGVASVIYTAPASVATNTSDRVAYIVTDQHDDDMANGTSTVPLAAACYAVGTRILTVRGEIAIEALRVGDLAVTFTGRGATLKPIRWLGRRRIDLRRHPDAENTHPVRICAGALAEGVPHRDLLVSPGHRIRQDETLVTALDLTNGATIVQESPDEVEYWHVELDGHDIILAEGVEAETYQDVGNRDAFENNEIVAWSPVLDGLVPEPCRPYAKASATLRDRLAARATALGWTRRVHEPSPWLEASGQMIEPVRRGTRWRFILPTGCSTARLRSRAVRPWDTVPGSNDRRPLGLALHSLSIGHSKVMQEVALVSPHLSQGFYGVEQGETGRAWRWTNGDALLPLTELTSRRVTVVEITFEQDLDIWVAPPPPALVAVEVI